MCNTQLEIQINTNQQQQRTINSQTKPQHQDHHQQQQQQHDRQHQQQHQDHHHHQKQQRDTCASWGQSIDTQQELQHPTQLSRRPFKHKIDTRMTPNPRLSQTCT